MNGSLRDAEPRPFWTDRPGAPDPCAPTSRGMRCDVLVVGGGFTGLWAAIEARRSHPSADITLLEASQIASGASGRNAGIATSSLSPGGAEESMTLRRLGRENLDDIEAFARAVGGSTVLDQTGPSPDIALVDPAALCWALKAEALREGVRVHEHTAVRSMRVSHGAVEVATNHGSVVANGVVLATSTHAPVLHDLKRHLRPVHDHVLVTEPLPPDALSRIDWGAGCLAVTSGRRVPYFRRTADDRILIGGRYAAYHRGFRAYTQRDAAHAWLAEQFTLLFPALSDVRFTHRWNGLVDSTTRATPLFGTAMSGRVAYALGYGGAGIAASRFGARVALDLLSGLDTERTRLDIVSRRRPTMFGVPHRGRSQVPRAQVV